MATLSWITIVVMVIVALIHIPTTNAKKKPKPAKLQPMIRNCKELPKDSKSGIYTIYPCKCCQHAVKVYCDMKTDGGGWTVIQRRDDVKLPSGARENFYRTWMYYALGFGNLLGQHWLGLDHIHCLTDQTVYSLRVDLGDWSGNTRWAKYNLFYVHDRSLNYTMEVDGYTGNAGDSLSYSSGYQFSTKDKENDVYASRHCAVYYTTPWWHKSCMLSSLNGVYYTSNPCPIGKGLYWYHWLGSKYSLKKTEMKIRPAY